MTQGTLEVAQNATVPANALEITLALALTATLAAAAAVTIARLAQRLLNAVAREDLAAQPLAERTLRVVRGITFVVIFLALAFPALDLAGVRPAIGLGSEELGRWAAATGLRILSLVLLAYVAARVVSVVIQRAERDIDVGAGLEALERRKRAQTIASLARRSLTGLIWATAVLMVLRELDVDITPVLAGAGILGLAIGFGAQTLVRDVITGFFLIIEDQVRVGDVATVNGIGGLVEQINLRTIVLRDLEGVVHVVPNGEIKTLANRTKDFAYYVVDLGINYYDDIDQMTAIVQEAGRELLADPKFAPSILEPVEILGVDDFRETAVTLKFRIKTLPIKQWEVGREFRRRIKIIMDREGVRLPFPQLGVHVMRERRRE